MEKCFSTEFFLPLQTEKSKNQCRIYINKVKLKVAPDTNKGFKNEKTTQNIDNGDGLHRDDGMRFLQKKQ